MGAASKPVSSGWLTGLVFNPSFSAQVGAHSGFSAATQPVRIVDPG
jgi:hypothetical protein